MKGQVAPESGPGAGEGWKGGTGEFSVTRAEPQSVQLWEGSGYGNSTRCGGQITAYPKSFGPPGHCEHLDHCVSLAHCVFRSLHTIGHCRPLCHCIPPDHCGPAGNCVHTGRSLWNPRSLWAPRSLHIPGHYGTLGHYGLHVIAYP